ncbi:hypothetical protein [Furfurilactobacillus milii]|uniref:Uncharacterized protein n=1 Tax=Furfurilactobacillus milii TaxID=2888272 RepID=A0ABT6DDN1_9LACO|nr:hypothetical protein [Furfurilactobacillus milii]QLE67415.1 hypothetical protein LROSL2_2065 [Furfurilactobacillus rossiae]MCF6161907.1 hypothetical protein [Furfurilactobacillus milii]MCF6164287.1 hypothetical protein [Furfurilactobacillus milii]MDF9914912.1 hypothetical protein [Furfurilactobacillus milii]QLE69844.1 hypothetical protein LROSL3_2123 [Furfurilactobacillus rossiae]
MADNVIKLTIPQDHLDFEIGGKTFTASFADKSVAKFRAEALNIEKAEIKNTQEVDRLATEAAHKKEQARDEEHNKVKPNEVTLQKKLAAMDREYNRKFTHVYENANEKATVQYKAYLDELFGKGSGDAIYKMCSQSSNVLAKIVAQILANMTQATNLADYQKHYEEEIAAIKTGEKQGE